MTIINDLYHHIFHKIEIQKIIFFNSWDLENTSICENCVIYTRTKMDGENNSLNTKFYVSDKKN